MLMGVSGDEVDPFEFHNLYTGSLNTWKFYCFMEDFIEWLDFVDIGRLCRAIVMCPRQFYVYVRQFWSNVRLFFVGTIYFIVYIGINIPV